jgi:eukaryotic-like serine/threonine-protein kinase
MAAGLAGLAALLAAGLWLLARPRAGGKPAADAAAVAPAPRRSVAVLPFADQTGETSLAWAGSGIAEMLSANLSESSNLRVLDSVRVARGVRDLRVPPGPLDENLARQLSELWSVDSLVTGTVRRAGSRVRVDVAVLQPAAAGTPTRASFGAEGNGESEIFRVASVLGGELKRRLGVRETRSDVAGLQTASLAAARAYEEGKGFLSRGDELDAAPAFERAVAADPRFAAALEKLAETYQSLGFHEKAVQAAERAATAAGGGDGRSAWRARARLALVRGDPAEAEKSYRQLLRRYPNDTEQRLDLAGAQAAQGHHADAVETLKAVVAVDPNDPRAWLLLGRSTIATGDSPRAIQDYLVRALALQTQLGNQKGKADVLAATARAYQNVNDFPKALESFTAARSIQSAIGDDRGLAGTLRGRALILQAMGKLKEAETDLQAARGLYEKIGDSAGVAAAWNASGVIEEARGNYGPALEDYQNALKLRRALGDERLLAQSYDNIGYIYYLQGQYDNGLVFWNQALDLRRRIGGKGGIVLSLQNLGFLATAQGRWDEATKLFAEALEKSRDTSQKDAIVISLGNLGVLQGLRGRFSAALSSLDEALADARQMQFQGALVEFTLKKAALLFDLGRREDASALADEASKWIGDTGNSEQAADLEVLRSEWSLARGDRGAAGAASRRSLPLAKKSGSKVTLLEARIAAAESSSPPDARALAEALAEAESIGHSLLTMRAAEALARAELSRGSRREAEGRVKRAVEVGEHAGWAAGLYRLYVLQARISEGLGEKASAASARERGAAQIAKIRNELPAEFRASFDGLPDVREILHETKPETVRPQPKTGRGTPS